MGYSGKGLQSCICSRLSKERKSFSTKYDVILGIALSLIILIYLTLKVRDVIPIWFIVLVVPWLVLLIIRLAMGHSLMCSARWGIINVLGALGGFGFLSF